MEILKWRNSEIGVFWERSKTYEKLFDPECGLWMNGPDYILDEYIIETEGVCEAGIMGVE